MPQHRRRKSPTPGRGCHAPRAAKESSVTIGRGIAADLDDGVVFPKTFGVMAAALVTLVIAGCGAGPELPPIPEGIPPGPGAVIPVIDLDGPGRTALQLRNWASEQSGTGISSVALEAYGYAAAVMGRAKPECGIGWTTIAGIASVESRHGTHGRSGLDDDGTVRPPIVGIALDGSPGVALIRDTDGGALDGDDVNDRAVGPLQFIPETWKRWGVDANGDGVADPQNIDDAALTAARYLCASGGDLTSEPGWQKALLTYNQSNSYLLTVRHRAAAYSVGRRV